MPLNALKLVLAATIKVLLPMMSSHGRRVQLVLQLLGNNVAAAMTVEAMILAMLPRATLHHGQRVDADKTTVVVMLTTAAAKMATMLHHPHPAAPLHGNKLLLLTPLLVLPVDMAATLHLAMALAILKQAWELPLASLLLPD